MASIKIRRTHARHRARARFGFWQRWPRIHVWHAIAILLPTLEMHTADIWYRRKWHRRKNYLECSNALQNLNQQSLKKSLYLFTLSRECDRFGWLEPSMMIGKYRSYWLAAIEEDSAVDGFAETHHIKNDDKTFSSVHSWTILYRRRQFTCKI